MGRQGIFFIPLVYLLSALFQMPGIQATQAAADVLTMLFAIPIQRNALRKLGLDTSVIRRVSVCMYEGEINMVIHANGGAARVEVGLDDITIILTDRGPGIPDIEKAMQAGWTTAADSVRDLGFGAGMGLPNMKKYTDEMKIDSTVGVGTTVTMVVNLA